MRRSLSVAAAFLLLFSSAAHALIIGGTGNDPVHDPGWPLGSLEVANLKSRVGWWEGPPFGGGQHSYLYRGDTETFNKALEAFAKIRTPSRELVVHDGPHENWYLKLEREENKKTDARVDWTFTVCVPSSWHQLYNAPTSVFAADQPQFRRPVDPPRVDVYVGSGGIDWSKVKVPAGVRVTDKRAASLGVKVEGGAMVRVNVYDMATGKPVAKAKVTVVKNAGPNWEKLEAVGQGVADDTGLVDVTKLPAGTVRIAVEAEGYASRLIGYESLTANTFREFDVELMKAATLTGTVTDQTGKPIEGVTIRPTALAIDSRGYPSPASLETKTDAQGKFQISGLPKGYAQIWAHKDGHHQTDIFKIVTVPGEGGAKVVMNATGGLQCKVVDKNGKPPQDRVNLFIEPEVGGLGSWGGSGLVGPDGTIDFKNVPPGKYFISTKRDSNLKLTNAVEVNIIAGKTIEVTVKHE